MNDYKKLYLDRGRLIKKQEEANDILFAENQRLKKQLDAAVSDLHGLCRCCINYSENHNQGKCRFCCYENARDRDAEVNDNWRWRG